MRRPKPSVRGSNACIPLVASRILPIAAIAAEDTFQSSDSADAFDVFSLLVAQLAFDSEPQGRAMANFKRHIVHRIGENSLRMEGVDEVNALIIGRRAASDRLEIEAFEHDEARRGENAGPFKHAVKRRSGPFSNRAPTLDAIVPGDLAARGN